MLEEKKTKVKITFFVILVGISCMLAAMVTDHWTVLSPPFDKFNATCETVHFGLWKLCMKTVFMVEEDPEGQGCGPISLPGGKGCFYPLSLLGSGSLPRARRPLLYILQVVRRSTFIGMNLVLQAELS